MPEQLFTNNATTLLDADIGSGDTSLTVTAAEGALFPLPTAGDWFYATIQSGALIEIVQVTTRATDTFSVIVRAQEGTSAIGWTAGATIELRVTKAWLDSVRTTDTDPAPGDVVGPASAVDERVAFFDGVSGKLIKDSGLLLSGSNTGDQTLPIDSTLTVTDNTGNDASVTAHGFAPKGTNTGTKFLRDDLTYAVPTGGTGAAEAVINGSMHLWQRGTSFTALATGSESADRWKFSLASAGTVDVARLGLSDAAIFTATGQKLNYGMRMTVNTNDASMDAADLAVMSQFFEGYRILPYLHNEFTWSMYVRSSITGTFCMAFRSSNGDRSYLQTFTIDVADTWERKVITVKVQDQTGTWDYKTGVGLIVSIVLVAGTDHEGTDAAWNSSSLFTVAGQTNWMNAGADTFDITGCQMDLGPDAQPLRGVPWGEDALAAYRYYQKSYSHDDAPGALTTEGEEGTRAHTTAGVYSIAFRVPMRIPPAMTAHNPNNTGNDWRDEDAAGDVAVTFNVIGEKRALVGITSVDTNQYSGHWEADAEL